MPSLNDFINTTLGGIALGEMFHRAGWLVRNTRATGRGRLWSEIGAMALDPVTGANRFITGDASRVTEKPKSLVPSSLGGIMAAGVLWRGSETRAIDAKGQPFLEMDLLYGDPKTGRSLTPYEAFAVRLRFGGGAGFSEARVRGRLAGMPIKNSNFQFGVLQSYDFQTNDAYSTGSQSFEAAVALTQKLSTRTSMWLMGWGGATVLGAVDSLPLGVTEVPEEPEPGEESPGQGVSEGPRFYDYGPGGNFGFTAEFARNGRMFALFSYEGRHLYSLDGVRANHFLGRTRLDLLLPLRGQVRLRHVGRVPRASHLLPGRGSHGATISLSAVSHVLHVEAVVTPQLRVAAHPLHRRRHLARPGFCRSPVRSAGRYRGHFWPIHSGIETLAGCGWWAHHPAGRLSDLRAGFSVPPRGKRARQHRVPRD